MTARTLSPGTFWAAFPAVLLGGLVTIVMGMAYVAVSDPSFAVTDGYYARALSWDEQVAARTRSAALGWKGEVHATRMPEGDVEVVVRLTDRAGKPVTGTHVDVTAFPVALSRYVSRGVLVESAPGEYRVRIPLRRDGWTEIDVDATRGGDRFTQTERRNVVPFGK
ncbi:MAG TPA: FixH family protein [Polyangiaceae bacterium]|nr:FixH family protein [Polyangiaceae bacterium]